MYRRSVVRLSSLCSPHGFEAIPSRVTIVASPFACELYDYKVDTVFPRKYHRVRDHPRFVKRSINIFANFSPLKGFDYS